MWNYSATKSIATLGAAAFVAQQSKVAEKSHEDAQVKELPKNEIKVEAPAPPKPAPVAENPSLLVRVIAAALSIVGQKEKPGNSGFKDPTFEKRMKDVGWLKFQAWCVYTVELTWKVGFGEKHSLYSALDKLFSGSAVVSWRNFKASKQFKTGQVPKAGALAFFQHGKSAQGHAALVIEVLPAPKFQTVEGNTNASGGREGIEVAKMSRKTGQPFSAKGLNLLGFVYLPEE